MSGDSDRRPYPLWGSEGYGRSTITDHVPGDELTTTSKRRLVRYGLGAILAGNAYGALSAYALSQAGVTWTLSLVWIVAIALPLGLVFHELLAALASHDQPLFLALYDQVGTGAAGLIAPLASLSAVWVVVNYTAAAAVLGLLIPPQTTAFTAYHWAAFVAIASTLLVIHHVYSTAETYFAPC